MSFNVRNATIAEGARVLQGSILDKLVVGQPDFTLKVTPNAGQVAGFSGGSPPRLVANNIDGPPDVFAAFQLGLKLGSTKTPADVLIIDHVEQAVAELDSNQIWREFGDHPFPPVRKGIA